MCRCDHVTRQGVIGIIVTVKVPIKIKSRLDVRHGRTYRVFGLDILVRLRSLDTYFLNKEAIYFHINLNKK